MGLGAIAVFRARSGKPPSEVVQAMAAVVPHRGSRVELLVLGRCALACVNEDDPADAGLATAAGVAAAFAGRLDNAREFAAEL